MSTQEDRKVGLVIDAEERLAIFTLLLVLIDELVEGVKVVWGCAVHVVPPVADEILLVENGSIGAQKWVVVSVGLAHVEHLIHHSASDNECSLENCNRMDVPDNRHQCLRRCLGIAEDRNQSQCRAQRPGQESRLQLDLSLHVWFNYFVCSFTTAWLRHL